MPTDGDGPRTRATFEQRAIRVAACADVHCRTDRPNPTPHAFDGLEEGLAQVAVCPLRIVLLHYAPISDTLVGERPEIWTFLGTDRLAAPLIDHAPDLVVHGHAHAGTFAGKVGEVDVFNVSVPVIGREYWLFELEAEAATRSAIH